MPPSLPRIRGSSLGGGISLTSAAAVHNLARLLDRADSATPTARRRNPNCAHDERDRADDEDEEDEEEEEGEESSDDDDDDFRSAPSVPSSPAAPSPDRDSSPERAPDPRHPAPAHGPAALCTLTLAIPPSELATPAFPVAVLTRILAAVGPHLARLTVLHAEALLAHAPALLPPGALPRLTHLVAHAVGPRAYDAISRLACRLEEAELEFNQNWVGAVAAAPASHAHSAATATLFPALPNGRASGLPTPAPSPAVTPAVSGAVLPDPVPLLAHSMQTLRVLRASNALVVTVADTLRFPAVRALSLRIAGVPTVTPLVHAFPGVAELYVYTAYDGCGAVLTRPARDGEPGVRPPPLPPIEATREANRTSQTYSSFPPLARVRGFAPGLYALGLMCPVFHLEVGAIAPRLGDRVSRSKKASAAAVAAVDEAEMVRTVLADTAPARVVLEFERGWWAADGAGRRGEKERGAFRALFEGAAPGEGTGGVKTLVVRVEEPGRWADVTKDVAALLRPLASSLSTFVLRWDRTSVPFDRVPPDDDDEDEAVRSPGPAQQHSRTEAFARHLAEDLPALRYVCTELVLDAPAPAPPAPVVRSPLHPLSPGSPGSPDSIWSAEAQNVVAEAVRGKLSPPAHAQAHGVDVRFASVPPARRVERRFWRVERGVGAEGTGEGWVCLDPLDERAGRRVLDAEGLRFEDGVRY